MTAYQKAKQNYQDKYDVSAEDMTYRVLDYTDMQDNDKFHDDYKYDYTVIK